MMLCNMTVVIQTIYSFLLIFFLLKIYIYIILAVLPFVKYRKQSFSTHFDRLTLYFRHFSLHFVVLFPIGNYILGIV